MRTHTRSKRSSSLLSSRRKQNLVRLSKSPLLQAYNAATAEKKKELLSQIILAMASDSETHNALGTVCPVGSVQEYLLADFQSESSIPLQLPFWILLSVVGQYLCGKGAVVELPDESKVVPTLYNLLLADSGECKTWTYNLLAKALTHSLSSTFKSGLCVLNTPKSPEGLMNQMAPLAKAGKAMALHWDEFGNAWQRMQADKMNGGAYKNILLRAYTQEDIVEQLKIEKYEILKPKLSLLAFTQTKLFNQHFSAEDWLSGLMQRLTLVVCPPRPDWHLRLRLDPVALKLEEKSLPMLRQLIKDTPVLGSYKLSETSLDYINASISELIPRFRIEKGFALRALYSAYKYSLIFHYLSGNTSNQIGLESARLAINLVTITFSDLRCLIDDTERSDLSDILEKAIAKRLQFYRGEIPAPAKWSARWLMQRVRGVDSHNVELIMTIAEEEVQREILQGSHSAAASVALPAPVKVIDWEKREAKELGRPNPTSVVAKAVPPPKEEAKVEDVVRIPEPVESVTVTEADLPALPTTDEGAEPLITDEQPWGFVPLLDPEYMAFLRKQEQEKFDKWAKRDGILEALKYRWRS
jgi:hypothetical protein